MKLHKKLRNSREELGIPQYEVAKELGLTPQAIARYESPEKKTPPMNYINFLAKRGIDRDWLLKEDEGEEDTQVQSTENKDNKTKNKSEEEQKRRPTKDRKIFELKKEVTQLKEEVLKLRLYMCFPVHNLKNDFPLFQYSIRRN